uniref:Sarcoglycan delta n=1 Tax=Paramormyrops kingsleyae TaxID=1676925 RepID=A0A3B3T962_9TELE
MIQEQCADRNNVQTAEKPQVSYKVGIYGWRKRCLYCFVLLLMVLILVNLALTIWILKVMNFTMEGMGHLRITKTGLELNGDSEFLRPLYAKEIQSRPGSPLFLQSSKNVSISILDGKNKAVTQLVAGSSGIHACCKLLEVKSNTGKLLFSADAHEVVVGAEKLRVPGTSLYMEAPKGVQIMAEAGDIRATCRSEMRLESKDGEITLDARKIKFPRLPEGKASATGSRQTVFEVCVCPNGKLYLSQAGSGSTCHINSSVCL